MPKIKVVVTCFLMSRNKILILRRSSRVGTYQGRWGGVSGYVETTPEEQAIIEIREETGLQATELHLVRQGNPVQVLDENIDTLWIVNPFLFKVNESGKIRIDWEHQEARWIDPEEIDNYPTVPNLKEAWLSVMGKKDEITS